MKNDGATFIKDWQKIHRWMTNPYPTGTFTLQDAPTFAWRANAHGERLQGKTAYDTTKFLIYMAK